jgi:hypothetical protein
MTAGLRWSVDTDRANQDLPTPLCSTVDPSIQFSGCTGNQPLFNFYGSTSGAGGEYGAIGYRTKQPYGNFGPQLGFVFSPGSHRTSLRGGIGIYFESDVFNNSGNSRTPVIQANGPYFAYGLAFNGGNSITLPGGGTVTTAPDGTPVSTILSESIYNAAPELNAIKAAYQGKVKNALTPNSSYIGTGGGLYANNIYAGPYKSPYSIQFNGGIQHEFTRGILFSADYVHNATLKVPLSVDVNRVGAANTLNTAAAQNAIAATTAALGCTGGYSAAAVNCAINSGATINSFAANGLDSGTNYLGGYSASYNGLTPSTGAAFPGVNPNVGEGLFILPIGRSGYDALQTVLQEQKSHPMRGITESNLSIAYTLSRIVSGNRATNNADQFFAGAQPWDQDDPNRYLGRSNLDHSNELSFGGSLGIKYGLQVGMIGHFFSAPATSLTLDALSGNTAQIFQTDVDGDGTIGDLVPSTNPGYYMHQIKQGNLNTLINNYNQTHAGQLTPAGQALVSAGLMTPQQLSALNAVQQPIATQVNNRPMMNSAFRSFDMNASYPIHLSHVREGMSIVPGVAMYNVFNMSNYGAQSGVLLNTSEIQSNGLLPDGYVNSPNDPLEADQLRVTRNSGTFDQGGPRTTEFQLKLNF